MIWGENPLFSETSISIFVVDWVAWHHVKNKNPHQNKLDVVETVSTRIAVSTLLKHIARKGLCFWNPGKKTCKCEEKLRKIMNTNLDVTLKRLSIISLSLHTTFSGSKTLGRSFVMCQMFFVGWKKQAVIPWHQTGPPNFMRWSFSGEKLPNKTKPILYKASSLIPPQKKTKKKTPLVLFPSFFWGNGRGMEWKPWFFHVRCDFFRDSIEPSIIYSSWWILLMVQKSGKLTNWSVGSFIPLFIYRVS